MSEILRTNEILSKGYGVSPKLVMIDENLSIEAKAIYAYLSSFCGSGNIAFPQISTIVSHLKVSNERFYKHFKLLIKYGYISVSQERTQGKFANNIYTLNTVIAPVVEDDEQPDIEFTEKENTDNGKTVDRNTVAEFSDNGKSKANNNNINNNSINNNNINNNKKEKERACVRADKSINKINNNISKDKKTDFDNLINSYTDNDELKETIYEFIKMRTAIKKPMTTKALDILLNKLNNLATDEDTKIKVLEQSIEHCWQTVYELKEKEDGKDIRDSEQFRTNVYGKTGGAKEHTTPKETANKYDIKIKPVTITDTDYSKII